MAGHPPIFDTPEKLSEKVGRVYFNSKPEPATITGPMLFFWNRQSFYDYESARHFLTPLKREGLGIDLFTKSIFSNSNAGGNLLD